jgi:F-box and WD-40 domain protein 1/11/F-box/WD-40 domain protein 7
VKVIEGISGWTLTMEYNNKLVYTGCDDRKIRVYRWPEIVEIEELAGHEDGVISLTFADRMVYSGSYDHSIRSWDLKEMMQRIYERECMEFEDIESKKYEVYYAVVFKNKKKKYPAKKKK